jgi:hypothetical protein
MAGRLSSLARYYISLRATYAHFRRPSTPKETMKNKKQLQYALASQVDRPSLPKAYYSFVVRPIAQFPFMFSPILPHPEKPKSVPLYLAEREIWWKE